MSIIIKKTRDDLDQSLFSRVKHLAFDEVTTKDFKIGYYGHFWTKEFHVSTMIPLEDDQLEDKLIAPTLDPPKFPSISIEELMKPILPKTYE